MGTRGYVVIRVGGRYYAFYSPCDSYPTGLGVEMMELIVQLIRRFAGDIRGMCECIKAKLAIMTVVVPSEVDSAWRASVCWSDCDVIDNILKARSGDVLEVEKATLPKHRIDIQYIWTLDFDSAELIMTTLGRNYEFAYNPALGMDHLSAMMEDAAARNFRQVSWPMKHLYRDPKTWIWAEAVDEYVGSHNLFQDSDDAQQAYRRDLFATIIQTWWRRLRAYRQALEPETGLLFQLAKRRFEAARGTA